MTKCLFCVTMKVLSRLPTTRCNTQEPSILRFVTILFEIMLQGVTLSCHMLEPRINLLIFSLRRYRAGLRLFAVQRAADAAVGHRQALRSGHRKGRGRSQLRLPDHVRRLDKYCHRGCPPGLVWAQILSARDVLRSTWGSQILSLGVFLRVSWGPKYCHRDVHWGTWA